jgi:hypothetical protein
LVGSGVDACRKAECQDSEKERRGGGHVGVSDRCWVIILILYYVCRLGLDL